MKPESQKEKKVGPFDVSFLKRDGIYITALMISLGACLFVGMKLDDVVVDMNEVWNEYVEENCICQGQFNMEMMYNGSENNGEDSQESGGDLYQNSEGGTAWSLRKPEG